VLFEPSTFKPITLYFEFRVSGMHGSEALSNTRVQVHTVFSCIEARERRRSADWLEDLRTSSALTMRRKPREKAAERERKRKKSAPGAGATTQQQQAEIN
jgi:hypothetical protein